MSEPQPQQPSPELEALIQQFVEAVRDESLPDNNTLDRATPQWEYRKCRNWYFKNCLTCISGPPYSHGPCLYLYWKEKGKLKKKYMGKDPENILSKKLEPFFAELRYYNVIVNLSVWVTYCQLSWVPLPSLEILSQLSQLVMSKVLLYLPSNSCVNIMK